jgi:hypothetical protein
LRDIPNTFHIPRTDARSIDFDFSGNAAVNFGF